MSICRGQSTLQIALVPKAQGGLSGMKAYGFGHRAKLPSPDLNRITSILEFVKSLKRGDPIAVIWLDACISYGRRDPLKNQDFATYKNTVGYFHELRADHRYNQYHIILEVGGVKGHSDIMSIPLSIVMSVREFKEGQMMIKGQRPIRLDARGYKVSGPTEKIGRR